MRQAAYEKAGLRWAGNELVRMPTVEATVEFFQNRKGCLDLRVRCLRTGKMLPRKLSRYADGHGVIVLYGKEAA